MSLSGSPSLKREGNIQNSFFSVNILKIVTGGTKYGYI